MLLFTHHEVGLFIVHLLMASDFVSVTPGDCDLYASVAAGDSQLCGGNHHLIQLVADEGYLSSDVSYSMNCGSSTTPWIIDALPGQRVNVTLLDFTYWRSFGQSSRTDSR